MIKLRQYREDSKNTLMRNFHYNKFFSDAYKPNHTQCNLSDQTIEDYNLSCKPDTRTFFQKVEETLQSSEQTTKFLKETAVLGSLAFVFTSFIICTTTFLYKGAYFTYNLSPKLFYSISMYSAYKAIDPIYKMVRYINGSADYMLSNLPSHILDEDIIKLCLENEECNKTITSIYKDNIDLDKPKLNTENFIFLSKYISDDKVTWVNHYNWNDVVNNILNNVHIIITEKENMNIEYKLEQAQKFRDSVKLMLNDMTKKEEKIFYTASVLSQYKNGIPILVFDDNDYFLSDTGIGLYSRHYELISIKKEHLDDIKSLKNIMLHEYFHGVLSRIFNSEALPYNNEEQKVKYKKALSATFNNFNKLFEQIEKAETCVTLASMKSQGGYNDDYGFIDNYHLDLSLSKMNLLHISLTILERKSSSNVAGCMYYDLIEHYFWLVKDIFKSNSVTEKEAIVYFFTSAEFQNPYGDILLQPILKYWEEEIEPELNLFISNNDQSDMCISYSKDDIFSLV